jgi:hypothetical protein
MPLITQIAEAVVAELNATTFSLPVTATRSYLPRVELAQLKTLQVTVVPSSLVVATASRGQSQQDVAIDIAVQHKPPGEQTADLDPLLALAEEIGEHFRGRRLDSFPDALWVKTEFKPIFAPEHLDQFRAFTSVLTLTFRVIQ